MKSTSNHTWQLRVTDAGMVCSLGLDAVTACAAADAGLSRVSTLRSVNPAIDTVLGGEQILGHALPCRRADGFVGLAKAVLLGRLALEDLAARAQSRADTGRSVLYLVLNDRHRQDCAAISDDVLEPGELPPPADDMPSARWRRQTARICELLGAEPAARRLGIGSCRVVLGGHTALAQAFALAGREFSSARHSRAYVAAIDCLIEPAELRAGANMRKLKSAESAVGYLPGEAAVCLVAEPVLGGESGAVSVLVRGHGERRCDSRSPASVSGRMLAEAVMETAAGGPTPSATAGWDVAGDLSGDPSRADEWGHCAVAWQALGGGPLGEPEWIAASIGECGAAGPAAQIALLLHRARRGRSSTRPTLMPLSEGDGSKAALVVH